MGTQVITLVFVASRETHSVRRMAFGYVSVSKVSEDKLTSQAWVPQSRVQGFDGDALCTSLAADYVNANEDPVDVAAVTVIVSGRVVATWAAPWVAPIGVTPTDEDEDED